jgi:sugar phosphate permease
VNSTINSHSTTAAAAKDESSSPARLGRGSITRSQVVFILSMLVASYFYSFFFRISASVVLPRLGTEWGLSSTIIGFISALFFYAYAVMQPLSGALNDRFGPVRIVAFGMLLTVISALLMGFANSALVFGIGRLLSGFALAPMLSGALVFQAAAFDSSQYTRLSSITYVVGNLGAVISVAPLELAIKTWGRQDVFVCLAAISLLIAMGLLSQRNRDPIRNRGGIFASQNTASQASQASQSKTSESLGMRLKQAFRTLRCSAQLKALLVVWAISTAALMVFQGLWAVSWYSSAYSLDSSAASGWATLIGVGVMLGNFIAGQVGNGAVQRRRAIRVFCTACALCWIALWLAISIRLPIYITGLIGLLLGASAGASHVQCTCAVNDIAPQGKSGALFGMMNLFNFITVIIFQSGTGFLLDRFSAQVAGTYTAQGFLIVMGIVGALVIFSLASLLILRPFSPDVLKEGGEIGTQLKATTKHRKH